MASVGEGNGGTAVVVHGFVKKMQRVIFRHGAGFFFLADICFMQEE